MNDTTTLAQQMVAAAPAASRNVNLSTDSKRMAVIVKLYSGVGVGMARVAQFISIRRTSTTAYPSSSTAKM